MGEGGGWKGKKSNSVWSDRFQRVRNVPLSVIIAKLYFWSSSLNFCLLKRQSVSSHSRSSSLSFCLLKRQGVSSHSWSSSLNFGLLKRQGVSSHSWSSSLSFCLLKRQSVSSHSRSSSLNFGLLKRQGVSYWIKQVVIDPRHVVMLLSLFIICLFLDSG